MNRKGDFISVIVLVTICFFFLAGCTDNLDVNDDFAEIYLGLNYSNDSRSISMEGDIPLINELDVYLTAIPEISGSYCSISSDVPVTSGTIIKFRPGKWDLSVQLKDGNIVYYTGSVSDYIITRSTSVVEIPVQVYTGGTGSLAFNITSEGDVSSWAVTLQAVGSENVVNVVNTGTTSVFTATVSDLVSGDYIITAMVYNDIDPSDADEKGGCVCQARVVDGMTTTVSGSVKINEFNTISVSAVSNVNGYITLTNASAGDGDTLILKWVDSDNFNSSCQYWTLSRRTFADNLSLQVLSSEIETVNKTYSFLFDADYIYELECFAESSSGDSVSGYGKIMILSLDSLFSGISGIEKSVDELIDSIGYSANLVKQYITYAFDKYVFITFRENEGSDSFYPQIIEKNTATGLTENLFAAPNGKEFGGWNTEKNGSGTAYSDEQVVTVSESIELFAQWVDSGLPSLVNLSVSDLDSENGFIRVSETEVRDGSEIELDWIPDVSDRDLSDDIDLQLYQIWSVKRRRLGEDGLTEIISENAYTTDNHYSFVFDSDYIYEIECSVRSNSRSVNEGFSKIAVCSVESAINKLYSLRSSVTRLQSVTDYLNELIRQMSECEL